MARRILNRKDLRAANDAAERRQTEDEEVDEEAGEEDEEEEEESGEGEGDADAEAEAEGDEDDEEAPVKKKKAAPKAKTAKPKAKAKPRTRAVKITRMKVVWGVFNNSNQCVASYAYPQKAEAEAHAVKLTADKRNTHFVQQVKEPMEEKKE
jgi:hypothetical protein